MGAAMMVGSTGLVATVLAQGSDPAAQPTASVPSPVAAPAVVAVAQGGTIKGSVKAGVVPLPGVSVTATNTLTGKKYATTTDIDGAFQMAVPRNGRYVVKTELTGFASVTQELLINASSENGGLPMQTAEFKMDLASRVTTTATETTTTTAGATTQVAGRTTSNSVARVGRGTQSLTVQSNESTDVTDASAGEGNTGAQLPSLATTSSDTTATESIAVTGQQGQTNGLAGFSEDDLRGRIQDMQRNGFTNGDIASSLSGVMQTGSFGPGGPGGGGPGGGGPGGGGPGGGFGGGGGRGGGGFNGFGGGFRGQNPNAWHGSFGYSGNNSALNANRRSYTGTDAPKANSQQNSLTASFSGTPYIPGLLKANTKQFVFLSVSESRSSSPSTAQYTVPTLAQRLGDLTPAYQIGTVVNGTVYDPNTGQAYTATGCNPALSAIDPNPTACIPYSELSGTTASASALAAQQLLAFYPLPNITPNALQDNYQANFPGSSHSAQASLRYNRSFGAAQTRGQRGSGGRGQGGGQNRNVAPTLRQSIAESFSYSHNASSSSSFSPELGGTAVSNGYNLTSSYTVGYGRINNSATLGWNRSRGLNSNYFTNGSVNPAQTAGINVGDSAIYSNPFYFGVPSVGMTGLSGLSESKTPSDSINQTITFSDFVSYSHKKHNMRYGFDFHRIHSDSIGGASPLGSFSFTGYATEDPKQQTCVLNSDPTNPTCNFATASGSAVADFLLGQPQQTKITAGLSKIYLRGNSWDWYAQDDWRARANLTFNYGLRWEYFSPYSENNYHLVNLNMTGSGSTLAINNVCPALFAGCQQAGSPPTLVKPDRSMYSPRVAVAWSPKFKWTKNTVVRSSYGINYNTGQYSRFASLMSFQQPFAVTQTNTLTTPNSATTCLLPSQTSSQTGTAMTLTNGFGCSTQSTQSNFGVNPKYRLGMVQAYNMGVQRTLPQGIVLNLDYTGSYAINQDIIRAPNRNASGVLTPTAGQFQYEDSLGYQRANIFSVNLRERMHKGVSLGATYTLAHSIDDATSVGGSGSSIAQDDQNLGAEESNSSFVVRNTLRGNFILEPPFGPNRAFLNKGGALAQIFDGYSISGSFTFASGAFATPQYSGTPAETATGAGSSLRPNRVAGQSIKGPRTLTEWFNTAAFSAPAAGTYGNASRNSIVLPESISLNTSLSRNVSFGGTRSFEARINMNNPLNTARYSSVNTQINQAGFGQVTGAAGMRSFTYNANFRF